MLDDDYDDNDDNHNDTDDDNHNEKLGSCR